MKFKFIFIFIFIFLSSSFTYASNYVPYNIQAAIFFKILSFNQTIKTNPGFKIRIGVLSVSDKNEIYRYFFKMSENKLLGKDVSVELVNDFDDLNSFDVIYIHNGKIKNIDETIRFCEKNKIITLTDNMSYIKKGVMVCLKIVNEKPKIVINQKACELINTNFHAQLMKLSEIIK